MSRTANLQLLRAGVCAACLLVAQPLLATLTDPVLAVTSATRIDGVAWSLVEIEASFPYDDLVQLPVPLQLLIHQPGTGDYLRFDLVEGARAGVEPGLADGLDLDEALALVAGGAPVAAATLVAVEPGRIAIQAPAAAIPSGSNLVIFLVEAGEAVLSNTVTIELAQ